MFTMYIVAKAMSIHYSDNIHTNIPKSYRVYVYIAIAGIHFMW